MVYPPGIAAEYHEVISVAAFDRIKRRLYTVSGCASFCELAAFLETSPAKISDARRRTIIPARWLQQAFLKVNAHPQWILTGEGERFVP